MGHSVVPSGGACGAAGARTRAACPYVQGGGAAQNIQHDGRTYVAGGFVYPISHRARDACMYNAWPSLSRRKENRVAVPRRWRGGSGPGQRAAVAVLSPPKPLKHADGDCKLLFCIFEIYIAYTSVQRAIALDHKVAHTTAARGAVEATQTYCGATEQPYRTM